MFVPLRCSDHRSRWRGVEADLDLSSTASSAPLARNRARARVAVQENALFPTHRPPCVIAMATALVDVPEFERVFRIPSNHQLLAIRSCSRGGPVLAEFWEHEEYGPGGNLVAFYESYEEITPSGPRHGCWRKFDVSGRLITVGGSLHGAWLSPL